MKDPYSSLSMFSSTHLQSRGYPPQIKKLVYPDVILAKPEHTLMWYDRLWFHPLQEGGDTTLRPTGHEVHKTLISENMIYRCFDFYALRHLQENPDEIPRQWLSLGILAHAWLSTAYDENQDMCVPNLYCRGGVLQIRWTPLALRMTGADATPITSY